MHAHMFAHVCTHTQAGWARSPCLAGCQETRPWGLSQSGKDDQSSTDGLVARGQCSGSEGGIGWSQVVGCFPDDLQSHGDTGELGHSVGQGAGGRSKLPQVGHGVHHAAQEEKQEVHPGHERVWPQEGVDEAQEQEGVDVLHVIPVCSGKARTCGQPSVSFENVMGAGALDPERPCTPGGHLRGASSNPLMARTRGTLEVGGTVTASWHLPAAVEAKPHEQAGSHGLLIGGPYQAVRLTRTRSLPVSPVFPSGLGPQVGKVEL